MSHAARYHLIFEGFKPGVNKTAISFTLKDQLQLKENQLADMMAGRHTVLRQNMDKETALALGKELTQSGLIIKAKALATNQKNSPQDLRNHLLNGGLDQYFASRYRHPDEETDTIMSLGVLAAFAIGSYFLLPLIGLGLLLPVLSPTTWATQFFAALIQVIIALLMFVPAIWLFPRPKKVKGLELDSDTEELLFAIVDNLTVHLSAPQIKQIVLVENPILMLHQTPTQWVTNKATLELGLPILETLNVQQFVGLMGMRAAPLSSRLHVRTWGLFIQWYDSLRTKHRSWAMLLNNWVSPIRQHQQKRGFDIARQLVGLQVAQQLQKLDKRFEQLDQDWPEFMDYCQQLRIRGTHWQGLVGKLAKNEAEPGEQEALFRMESPSLWLLSTIDGYQKMFQREDSNARFEMNGTQLWQKFQTYLPQADEFTKRLLRPDALYPPTGTPAKPHKNALLVNRRASTYMSAQKQIIEQSLSLKDKPKKPKDIQLMAQKWCHTSAGMWPKSAYSHPRLPLVKALFNAKQTLQLLAVWQGLGDQREDAQRQEQKQQIQTLQQKWFKQAATLPGLPLIGEGKTLADQLKLNDEPHSLDDSLPHWQAVITIFWVFIAGQLLNDEKQLES